MPFKMAVTNYTTRITSNYCDVHFMRNTQGNKMFAAYAMLKADVATVENPPVIEKTNVAYFDSGFSRNVFLNTVYNFDLKSAYATCLYVNKYISKRTFDYLGTLPKMDRLSAVGMLAGQKSIFDVDGKGDVIGEETIVSPYQDFFFFCVDEVSRLMNYAASYAGNSFLFTWVDGIYFNPGEKADAENYYKILSPVFTDAGYKTSFDVLKNFSAVSKKDCWVVEFLKEGKPKIFNIPKKEVALKKRLETFLLHKSYNKFNNNLKPKENAQIENTER